MMKFSLSALLLLVGACGISAFSTSPAPSKPAVCLFAESSSPQTANDAEASTTVDSTEGSSARPPTIYIPLSFEEMVKQVSSTMEDAMKAGKKRQIYRILLPRSSDNENLGQFYETNVVDPDPSIYVDTILVPPDESWQGGIMQLYRAASLACQEILRCVRKNEKKESYSQCDTHHSFPFHLFYWKLSFCRCFVQFFMK